MARFTVEQILKQIAATVNQAATAPTSGGTEYNLWLEFMNRAQAEWSDSFDWEETRKIFSPSVTGTSQATVALPKDFKNMAAAPRLYVTGNTTEGEEFPNVPVEDMGLYDKTDKYVYQLGNPSDSYSLMFHPATLASGASIVVQYFSTPTSLASPAEVPVMSDSQNLVDRSISYILEARSDPRFQQQEAKARERLLTMVENANLMKYSSYNNPQYVKNAPLQKRGFRVGRD